MRCGIAVHLFIDDRNHPEPYFLWALAISRSANGWSNDDVTLYEIVRDEKMPPGWTQQSSVVKPLDSPNFRGIVELFSLDSDDGSFEMLDQQIRNYPADPDPDFSVPGPTGWTSAAWVIKVTADLADTGWWDLPPEVTWNTFYRTVLDKACLCDDLFGSPGTPFPVLQLVHRSNICLSSHTG